MADSEQERVESEMSMTESQDGVLQGAKRRIAYPRSAIRYPLLVSALLALTGCATPPPEPDYSATAPQPMPEETAGNGAIYQVGHDIALFENSVARRVGDTLTVRLNERTNASKSSTTSTKKATEAKLPGPTIAGQPVTEFLHARRALFADHAYQNRAARAF